MYSPTKLRLQLYLHSYLHLNRLIFLYMWASRHLGDWEGESDGLVAVSFPCPLWILSGSKTFPQREKQADRLVSLANVFQICPHFKKCWHHCNFCAALCIWHGCMRLPSSAWAGVTVRGSPLLGLSNTQALFSTSGTFCLLFPRHLPIAKSPESLNLHSIEPFHLKSGQLTWVWSRPGVKRFQSISSKQPRMLTSLEESPFGVNALTAGERLLGNTAPQALPWAMHIHI